MRGPQRYAEWAACPATKVPRRRVTVKLHLHTSRETCRRSRRASSLPVWRLGRERKRRSRARVWQVQGADRQSERQAQRRTHNGDGGTGAGGGFAPTAERARKREGVRGRSPLPQHGRPSRAPRRRAAAMPTGRPPRTGGQRPKGENLGHAQRHHWLMIPEFVREATPDAKRQRTCGRWRSEVFRAATCHTGGSGHPPTSSGARSAKHPKGGRP